MFFFAKFPKIEYGFINDKNKKNTTNILSAFFLRKISSLHNAIFDQYVIRDDDSIESLANKIYRNPMYYWVLLIANDIIDPYTEWAMPYNVMERFVRKKYENGIQRKLKNGEMDTLPESVGLGGIHHFINVQTNQILDDYDDLVYRQLWADSSGQIGNNIFPITNLQYEQDLNMKKRKILLIAPNHIINFVEDFKAMLKGTKK